MKKFITFLLSSFLATVSLYAQLDLKPAAGNDTRPSRATPGEKIVQLAKAIKPGSLAPAFNKSLPTFVTDAGNSTDAGGMVKNISILISSIKPDRFKNGGTAADLAKEARVANTILSAKTLLLHLETSLKPKALTDIWQLQRNQWMKELIADQPAGK